jgi:chromosome segregation ATPase
MDLTDQKLRSNRRHAPSPYRTQTDTGFVHAHCAAQIQQLKAALDKQVQENAALKNSIDLKERQRAHLAESLANLEKASQDGAAAHTKWTDRINSLTEKLAQAENWLAQQKETLTAVMQKYTGVCHEINTAYSRVHKDNDATLKDLCARTETLLDQQNVLVEDRIL